MDFSVPPGQRDSTQLEADVILSGNNVTIAHTSIVRPEPGRPTDVKIDMLPVSELLREVVVVLVLSFFRAPSLITAYFVVLAERKNREQR